MWNEAYLESKVLSASPVELVGMLYEGALGAVGDARACLAKGEIAGRSAAISKALLILNELTCSLDHEHGEELSRRLAGLYTYMQERLIEANVQQADAPLAETAALLATLAEAWQSGPAVQPQHRSAPAILTQAADAWCAPAQEYAPQAWSL